MSGATILAQSLKQQGVKYVFGVVGVPIMEVVVAIQNEGIPFIGMRNEQSAAYAASAIGYLTGRPGACLVVSGPGLVHALGGLVNACENGWPMILLSGSSDKGLHGKGAFQESPQVDMSRPFAKQVYQVLDPQRFPFFIEKAVRESMFGRPGGVYVDFPGDLVNAPVDMDQVEWSKPVPQPPLCFPPPHEVTKAVGILRSAKSPLVIIGKGAAFSRAEVVLREFIRTTNLPFLATPMGKGVVPDTDSHCVNKARTAALKNADVILLLGARLNWILHFGAPPRFSPDAIFIQMDLCAEELGNNFNNSESSLLMLCDVACGVKALLEEWQRQTGQQQPLQSSWTRELAAAGEANERKIAMQLKADAPMNYYSLYHVVTTVAMPSRDDHWIIINEGANTMDIGRTMMLNDRPRHRLDAGSYGTMGVGLGFAIAAALYCHDFAPHERVLCVEGDSAVGFSLAELDTMVRYRLPVLVIVVNNGGIYSGLDEESWSHVAGNVPSESLPLSLPPSSLGLKTRYDLVMSALGGRGWFVETQSALRSALEEAVREVRSAESRPCLINAMIDAGAERKEQEFNWLTRAKM